MTITSEKVYHAAIAYTHEPIDGNLAGMIARKVNELTTNPNEAAMFLAQLIFESNGFEHREEDPESRKYPDYYGRGFIKLTGEYNYKMAAKDLYNDETHFSRPENRKKIVEDPRVAMDVSIWIWKKVVRPDGGPSKNNFGLTTKAINGVIESDSNHPAAKRRYQLYLGIAFLLLVRDVAVNHYGIDSDVAPKRPSSPEPLPKPAPESLPKPAPKTSPKPVPKILKQPSPEPSPTFSWSFWDIFKFSGDDEGCPCIWCNNDL